jgi:hypothetical protein
VNPVEIVNLQRIPPTRVCPSCHLRRSSFEGDVCTWCADAEAKERRRQEILSWVAPRPSPYQPEAPERVPHWRDFD